MADNDKLNEEGRTLACMVVVVVSSLTEVSPLIYLCQVNRKWTCAQASINDAGLNWRKVDLLPNGVTKQEVMPELRGNISFATDDTD